VSGCGGCRGGALGGDVALDGARELGEVAGAEDAARRDANATYKRWAELGILVEDDDDGTEGERDLA
jgi:hypothetical protein